MMSSTHALGVVISDEYVCFVRWQEALVINVLQAGDSIGREGRE